MQIQHNDKPDSNRQ